MEIDSKPPRLIRLKGKLRIHTALVTVVMCLLILTSGSIIYVNYTKTSNAYVDDAAADLDRTTELVLAQIKGFFIPTHKFLLILKQLLEDEKVLTDSETFQTATMSMLHTFARFKTLGFGDPDGNAVIVSSVFPYSLWSKLATKYHITNAKFVIRIVKNRNGRYSDELRYYNSTMQFIQSIRPTRDELPKYEPSERPWYQKAINSHRGIWTDLYPFANGAQGISTAYPLYTKNGTLKTVLFADVTLGIIKNFLSLLPLGQNGFGVIIDTDGHLLIESEHGELCDYCPEKLGISTEELTKLAYQDSLKKADPLSPFMFSYGGETMLCKFSTFDKVFASDWRLGLILPEIDYVGHIKESSYKITYLSLIILAVAILLIYILSKIITKPILELSSDMKKIQNFDIDSSKQTSSFLYEICQMSNTLTQMKSSLQTFGYYVPKNLVRQLINKGMQAKLGGEKKQLTVMFTDVYDFTKIAENESVDDLIHQTSDYLEKVSLVVDSHKGTIDKFIGDGVMAFWGAPEEIENGVAHACEAVLTCREQIREANVKWKRLNKPQFVTRFSLNRGETIVGNLGSYLRMNYTAFGDTVNVCSRLESLNKVYGTEILVGESIYQEVKEHFTFRFVDFIAVKGKAQGLLVYELVASKSTSTSDEIELCALSDKAFEAYKEQKWDLAEKIYQEILAKHPEDQISKVFIGRINDYKKRPPEKDWRGLTSFYHK